MIIYISGPITGLKEEEYESNFNKAEQALRAVGFDTINPARFKQIMPKSATYEDYMDLSFLMLDKADAIYLLGGHKNSNGAKAELARARETGKVILYSFEYERELNAESSDADDKNSINKMDTKNAYQKYFKAAAAM